MSDSKYSFRREGNHFKLSSPKKEEAYQEPVESEERGRSERSIWSRLGHFFSVIFSVLVVMVSFLIAAPFFILSVLVKWVFLSFGLAVFWTLAFFFHRAFIMDNVGSTNPFESGWTVLILLVLGLIAAVIATLGEVRE